MGGDIALFLKNSATNVFRMVGLSAEKILYRIEDNIAPSGTPARIGKSFEVSVLTSLQCLSREV